MKRRNITTVENTRNTIWNLQNIPTHQQLALQWQPLIKRGIWAMLWNGHLSKIKCQTLVFCFHNARLPQTFIKPIRLSSVSERYIYIHKSKSSLNVLMFKSLKTREDSANGKRFPFCNVWNVRLICAPSFQKSNSLAGVIVEIFRYNVLQRRIPNISLIGRVSFRHRRRIFQYFPSNISLLCRNELRVPKLEIDSLYICENIPQNIGSYYGRFNTL